MAEVALLLVPNSNAIGSKNAPKLYTTPKQINIETKAQATATHPFKESTLSIEASEREYFAPAIESPLYETFFYQVMRLM